MTEKTYGESYLQKTWKKAIHLLIVFIIFSALLLSGVVKPAAAYTAPFKLMVFTDKQVYLDYGYDLATGVRSSSTDNTKGSFNQRPNVFAVLLDSDGNIVRGLTNANYSARLMDEERWNHSGAGLNSYPFYQVIQTSGTYYPDSSNIFPAFADTDNDGIFNSTLDVTDVNDLSGSKPPTTDQLNISINVTIIYQGVNYTTKVYVIFGTAGCYHPTNTFSSAHGRSGHSGTPCTTCHWGYQYGLGTHGANNSIMESDPARYTGRPTWTTITNWDYRTGLLNGTYNGTTFDNSGAGYCMECHGGPTMSNILDLGTQGYPSNNDQNADTINDSGRPSCSWYQGPNSTAPYPVCHGPQQGLDGSSKIVQTSLNGTDWKGWSLRPGASKSHNHSSSPKTNGTPCELCHAGGGAPGTGTGGMHNVAGLPNQSTEYLNVNDQCWGCHNRTDGWLNITVNGGAAVNHSRTDKCSNCHNDNNKLSVHRVPTGAFGGRWCLNCHNLTGKAPIDHKVDPAITNISNPDYIHANLNNRSDAANSSRICWGCHTNDTLVANGRVNSTGIPLAEHPDRFDMPRNCTGCHNNSDSVLNFGAPQTYRHTWYAPTMKTPAVTYCVNCHAQEEMINKWSDGVYPPKNGNESSSHYGKNRSFFFEPLIGTRQYCGYCHQNESTVMGPFARESNKVRSDHASKTNTPGCGNATCHNRGKMHEDTLVIPNFTESSISTTCLSCHNPANYNFHNGTVTCWDCHMGNVSSDNPTWIHPIQFVQYNGNFTGAKLTGATCYDCHKSNRVDNTVKSLSGKTPPKIYSQSHSNDPMNGTKWGDYWKYIPRTYEFADYKILGGSGEIDPANPFENIKAPSNDYMQLNETQTGSNNGGEIPYTRAEREINGPPVPNWTYSLRRISGTLTQIAMQDAYFGAPPGSLKAQLKTTSTSGSGTVSWNYSFYYRPNSIQFAYTNASVDYFINVSTGRTQTIYFRLIKPSGATVTLANASCCAAGGNSSWVTLRNDSFGADLDEDGSVTPYKIQLYAELSATRPNTNTYTVYFDNILLKFHEKVWNRYEIIINTTGVPTTGSSKLGMSYQMHMENATLMIYNRTLGDYEYLDTMYQGVFFDYVKDINSIHHIDPTGNGTGNVSIKLVDDDRSDMDEISDVMHIRYLYVFTDQGLQFPCEQCHSPNKHYVSPPIGSPSKFSAGNNINQSISSTGTWCQQCHWQGSANYSKMVQEFSVTRVPPENIPPEITGNATYAPTGGARDGSPYQNHSGFDLSDAGCFGCHGGNLSPNAGMTAFVHGVSEGAGGGGRNCTSCHNIGGSINNINFSQVMGSMHATLNSGAASTPQNASNKPCWGCHGTINGTFANESDQPDGGHNTSVYKSPRKCYDCHITGKLLFTSKNVTDHIQAGYTAVTDVKTSSDCSICHNNSVNNGYEPDAMGITGGSPIKASVSHYGSSVRLIETMGDVNTSQGCIYCHYDPNNSASWGSATDPRTSIMRPHVETQNNQCWGCHVQVGTLPSSFHNEKLFAGGGGTAPPVPSGTPKLLVATNRYVILDDWRTGGSLGPGFSNPGGNHGTDSFTGINTQINATALFIDDTGSPVIGRIITFNLYMPNGTELAAARINATTDGNGLANFSFDMNVRNFYGNWTVKASNGSFSDNTNFIYNWWGCGISGCNSGHPSSNPSGTQPRSSPYLSGRDSTTSASGSHNTICTNCHQSFDGKPGANSAGGANHLNNPSDVHRNITCDNVNCHAPISTHNTNQVIGSCYNSACHTPANRSDISNKSTLNGIVSSYSSDNGSTIYSTFHTPNSTVPCIICHGPMHNISKPEASEWNKRNNVTESSHCTTCHLNKSHSQNRAVDCSMCHSPDAHAPKFITNQTTASAANYTASRSSSAGCKDCHNNTGINSYFTGKGYAPGKIDSYAYNLTEHNNVVSCNTCHDRLHWTGYMNSTGMYQTTAAGAVSCLDCHSGTNSNVSGTVAYWGYMTPARSRHNNSVSCESCHAGSKHGIRFLQPDRVSFGSKLTPAKCVNCHQQGYAGAQRIPEPMNHSTNPYSGALWNGTQSRFWDNTSQLSTCNYCHGAVLHSTSPLGESNKVKGTNNLNQSLTNGYWCANCHYKNAPGYAGNLFAVQPPEVLNKNGLVPVSASDGTAFFNHSNDLSSSYDDARCRMCHNNNLGADATSLTFIHNAGTGSTGGSNCISCHDIGGSKNNVNFSAFSMSMHTTLNSGAQSAPQNVLNKPCWGCHGTLNGTFANESDQPESGHNTSVYKSPRKCDDCHMTGRLLFTIKNVTDHISSGYIPETDVNTSSYNPGYCSYCHNSSVNSGYEPDSMGIIGGSPVNASVSHYGTNRTENKMMAPGINSTDCVFCHRNTSNMITWGILAQSPANISNKNSSGGGTDHTQYTSSSQCSACHGGYSITSSFTFHDGALGNGSGASGGPDCRMCHDVNGSQKKVNFSTMNDSNSLHMNLNSMAFASDNAYNESKKCWACHGDGSQPSGHPTRYIAPSNCTDCHVNGSSPFGAMQATQHFWNGTSIKTPASKSCYSCHNVTGMLIPAYDPDGKGSVYGGSNGGNDSVSHYGRKRNDMAVQQNTTDYCDNCHKGSSAFPFMDGANRTIANHSSYDTNPGCRDCHDGGRLHNSTLYMTPLSLPNSTYCLSCHGIPGKGNTTIKNLERHNGTGTQCSQCHLNSSFGIHPVRYLQQDNSWSGSSVNAVNCTSCHQGAGISGFGNASKVPAIAHSTNEYSGALWNGTQSRFWDNRSQQPSCEYCHGRYTMHNASGLGNITKVKGTNNVRQNLSGGTWCANCHYAAAANYSGNRFTPQPPELKNSSGLVPDPANDGTQFYNHSGDFASGYDDAKCRTCHDNSLGAAATSSNFTHSLSASSGGPNCISCHGTGGSLGDGKRINQSAMNSTAALHKNLNSNAQVSNASFSESRKCWACHGDGTEPSGHQARYMAPYSCVDCHVPGTGQNMNYTPNSTLLNVTRHYLNGTSISTAAAADCYICHNKSEMMTGMNLDPDGAGTVGAGNSGNGSVSHYGKKRSDMAALDNTSYCNYCHNNISSVFPFANATNNKTIPNHSINYPSTNPGCAACHSSGRLHSSALVKQAFSFSGGAYCLSCHGKNTSGGANFTGSATSPKEGHNDSLCSQCHLSSTKGIHSARYLRQNGTWAASNASSANCTSCHQGQGMSGFSTAAIVQTPLWHSNDTYSGSLWNGTQQRFWDNRSQMSSCDYCHGKEAIHNTSGLGRSSLIQGTNLKNQSLSDSFWCANCHYNGAAPSGKYNYKGDLFNPVPPEIFNITGLVPANSSGGMLFQNHTTNIGGDWSDVRCKNCHGKDLPLGTTSATFVHRLNTSAPETGGADCLKCHASTATMVESEGTPMDMRINKTAFITYGVHRNMNSNAVSTVVLSDNRSKACWVCHGDGNQPIKHHVDYITPKGCEYCHVTGNDTPVYSHYPGSIFLGTIIYDASDTNRTCASCHFNSIVADTNITYGSAAIGRIKNASVSHYAVNRTMGLSMGAGATGVLPDTTYMNGCRDCHNLQGGPYGSNGLDYGNAREITSGHNDMGSTPVDCETVCHNSRKDVNNLSIPVSLHDSSIGIFVGGPACYTQGCHAQPNPGGDDGGGTR